MKWRWNRTLNKVIQQVQTPASSQVSEKVIRLVSGDVSMLIRFGAQLWGESPPRRTIAKQLFKIALDSKDQDAEFLYANLLARGWITDTRKPDPHTSFLHLKALADRNHGESLAVLGIRALKSQDLTKHDQGMEYLKKAVDAGSTQAQTFMGTLYKNSKHYDKALEYFEKAVEKGSAEALFQMGAMHQQGLLKDATPERAFHYYERSAEKGLALAQHNVAAYYIQGTKTVEPNVDMALAYWELAAEQGLDVSCMNLAHVLIHGWNGDKKYVNHDLARKHLNRIIQSPSTLKQDALKRLQEIL